MAHERANRPAGSKGNSFVPLIRGAPKTFEETQLPHIARHSTIEFPIPRDHVNAEWLASDAGKVFDNDAFIGAAAHPSVATPPGSPAVSVDYEAALNFAFPVDVDMALDG